jgi:hypothetical protein
MPRQRVHEWWKGIFSVEYLAWTDHGAYFLNGAGDVSCNPSASCMDPRRSQLRANSLVAGAPVRRQSSFRGRRMPLQALLLPLRAWLWCGAGSVLGDAKSRLT